MTITTTTPTTTPSARRRRRSRRVAAPLVAILALAACSGDDDEESDDTTASTADAADTIADTATTTADIATTAVEAPVTSAAPVTTAGGDTTATGAPDTTMPAEPFQFTAPEGDYTIVFPGEPEETSQTTPLPDGSTLPITFYLYQTQELAFGTAAIAYPEGTAIDLEGARDGAIASVSGTLLESEPIELQGRQGIQFVGDVGGQGTYISRVFAEGLRLYQIVAVVGGVAAPDDPEIAAFLDSFQFTT